MMLKAEQLLNLIDDVKPGKFITWPIYTGDDIEDAKTVESYVNGFFMTGVLMPIPIANLGLDIISVNVEYDDLKNLHIITIEGRVCKFKED